MNRLVGRAIGAALWAVWRGLVLQVAESRRSPMLAIYGLVQPLVIVTLVISARTAPDPGFVARTVAGVTMLSLWSLILWSAGTLLLRDRIVGALSTILVRPQPLAGILLGRTLCIALAGTVISFAVLAILTGPLHRPAALPDAWTLLLLGGLAAGSAACLGMLLSAIILIARGADRVLEALAYTVLVVGGLLVPTDLLPEWFRWPAAAVSLHYIVEMVGRRSADPGSVLAVIALSAVYFVLSLVVMRLALRRARRWGTLELV
jgi:ABC-2 type transport system permease protein